MCKMIRRLRGRFNLIDLKALEEINSLLPIGLKELVMKLINTKNLVHDQEGITINHKSFGLKINGGP